MLNYQFNPPQLKISLDKSELDDFLYFRNIVKNNYSTGCLIGISVCCDIDSSILSSIYDLYLAYRTIYNWRILGYSDAHFLSPESVASLKEDDLSQELVEQILLFSRPVALEFANNGNSCLDSHLYASHKCKRIYPNFPQVNLDYPFYINLEFYSESLSRGVKFPISFLEPSCVAILEFLTYDYFFPVKTVFYPIQLDKHPDFIDSLSQQIVSTGVDFIFYKSSDAPYTLKLNCSVSGRDFYFGELKPESVVYLYSVFDFYVNKIFPYDTMEIFCF